MQVATVGFYLAVAHALHLHIAPSDLAVIVPVSGVDPDGADLVWRPGRPGMGLQHLPRPAPAWLRESALLLSLSATALIMLFSLSGLAVYVGRKK